MSTKSIYNETDTERKPIGEALGYAMIKNPIKNRNRVYMGGIHLYEGKVLNVMDRNDSGDCLVISEAGMGDVLSEDIQVFVPIKKKHDVIMPADISVIDEMLWYNKAWQEGIEKFNNRFIMHCIMNQSVDKDFINK